MKKNLKQCNLGLFLTEKMSLTKWDKVGILEREIAPYNILAKYFNKIYIFTYDGRDELKYQERLAPNIEIVYKNIRMRAKDYRWLLPFIHIVKIYKCDFYKTNQLKSRASIIAKMINPKAKLILRTGWTVSLFEKKRTGREDKKIVRWEKLGYKICDKGIVTSQGDKSYLLEKYNIDDNKIKVIPNYIDTGRFQPDKNATKYDNRIVTIAKIDKQKNLLMLVKALENTGIILDIIGEESHKSNSLGVKDELINEANKLKVKINFLGRVDNIKIPGVLNQYKIFALPSLYEGMPKSLLEAMSAGLACLGTNVAGINEVVIDGKNGILVETKAQNIRKGLLELQNDKNLQTKLGQNAREFIQNNYSLETQIEKEIKIYEDFVK